MENITEELEKDKSDDELRGNDKEKELEDEEEHSNDGK